MSHTTPPLGELLTMHETLFALNLPLAKNDHARLVAYRAEIDAQRAHVATLTAERDFLTRENAELREPIPCPSMFCPYERRALQAEADLAGLRQRQQWQPMETAPKDGTPVFLLSKAQTIDAGPNGIHHHAPAVSIGHWWPEGTSWVDGDVYTLAVTGVWSVGSGWFQPNEVTHWMPLPDEPLPRVGDGTDSQ